MKDSNFFFFSQKLHKNIFKRNSQICTVIGKKICIYKKYFFYQSNIPEQST